MNYKFSSDARQAFIRYITLRKAQPLFSNARSIRNALDRMRLRQANRLVADLDRVLTAEDIMSLEASDVLASRVFSKPRAMPDHYRRGPRARTAGGQGGLASAVDKQTVVEGELARSERFNSRPSDSKSDALSS